MGAAISVVVVVTLGFLVTRIGTSAFVLTGMSRESARFQARSAFLGVGFTTTEAEAVVSHPVRRRILMWLMWLGNAGIVSVVGTLVLTLGGGDFTAGRLAVIFGGVTAVLLIARSALVDRAMARFIEPILCRVTDVNAADYGGLLHVSHGYSVDELKVQPDDWIAGRTVGEAALRQEGIALLGIERDGGGFVGVPHHEDRIEAGDTLILYGTRRQIRELDSRPAGADGDRAHAEAVRAFVAEYAPEHVRERADGDGDGNGRVEPGEAPASPSRTG